MVGVGAGAAQSRPGRAESQRLGDGLTALNPLTYVSEAMRGAVVPDVAHMRPVVTVPVMLGCTVLFIVIGMRGFRRRALS